GPAERPGQGSMAAAPAGSRPAREPSLPWWGRWDLALLLAAAPVAATGVLLGVGTATEALCWTLAGLECLAVAARLRRHRSAAAALGALGAVLLLLGASIAGSGWLALGLVGLAAVLTVLGALVESPWDLACRAGGALAAVAAGATALDWLAWPAQRSIDTAALVAAAVLAVTAVLARVLPEVDRQWWLVWGGAAAAVEALVAAIVLAPAAPATALGSWAVAAGLTVTAAALALVVSAVNVGWLREGAAAYLLAAIVVGLGSGEASPRAEVIAASGIAAASAVAVLAVTGGAGAPWRRALLVLGVPPTVWALLTAWVGGTGALGVPVALPLAVASLQAAAIGVAWRRVGFQMLSPALACAAWVSMGFDLLGAGPESVTIPAGFAALVAVGLWRHDRVQRSEPVASSEIVVLELSGVVLLVGPALASALAVGPGHALLAIVLGLAVAWWGVVTEVRRRVAAGAGTVLVGALLLVAAPLVALLPAWQGAGMWLLIAVAGLLAVLAAALVERGKSLARSGLARLAEATAGWE
ncbi:MAG: hypothetical protein ACTHJJ_18480, partial [Intrasporangium sp.]|uniref:hypothetical protein n=1 Tax=Intrasporangium sp. TaxID=1925024 RepID=UPI003F7EE6AA